MASCTISSWQYATSGASRWTNSGSPTSVTLYGGGSYVACIIFKTPTFSGTSNQITLSLNVVRMQGGNTSTSLYCKIGTTNPGTKPVDPYSDSAVGAIGDYTTMSCSGITYNSQKFTHTFTNTELKSNTTYYLWIFGGAGVQLYAHSSYNSISMTYTASSTTYAPTLSLSGGVAEGIYSLSREVSSTCATGGYHFGAQSATGPYYKKTNWISANNSGTIEFDSNTSFTQNQQRFVTVSTSSTSPIYSPSNYSSIWIPAYACVCYNYQQGYENFEYFLTSLDSTGNKYIGTIRTPNARTDGYTFYGFTNSSTSQNSYYAEGSSFSSAINGKTLYALFQKPGTTTSINLYNCATSSVATAKQTTPTSYLYGKGLKTSNTPSYTNGSYSPTAPSGYTSFKGWAINNTTYNSFPYLTPKAAFEAGYTGSSLYAVWEGTTTTQCTLNGNGYTISYSYAQKSVTRRKYGTGSIVSLSTDYTNGSYKPTSSSATFKTWNTYSSGGGTSYSNPSTALDAGYTGTLYAIWTPNEYTIIFDPGYYGSGTAFERTTSSYQLTMPVSNTFTRSAGTTYYLNYYLQGGTMSTPSGFSKSTSSTNATYPRFQTSNKTTYYHTWWNTDYQGITKNNEGVDCWRCNTSYTFSSSITVYPEWSSSVPLYTLPTPTRDGYTFIEWNTNSSGTGTTYAAGKTYYLTSNSNFYAIWTANTYTINYLQGDATTRGAPTSQSATCNVAISLSTPTTYWKKNNTTANSTSYTTTYYLQGGKLDTWNGPNSYSSSGTNTTYGTYYICSSTAYDTISYTHNGWATSSGGSKVYNFGDGYSQSTTTTKNFYPSWSTATTHTYAQRKMPTVSRIGYVLKGWSTSPSGAITYAVGAIDSAADNSKTLYAIWEPEWTVKISNGTVWSNYHVWIYTGATTNGGWQQAIPYVYNNSTWKLTSI